MKDHTSKSLKFIAYLFLTFPVSYLIFATLLFDLPPVQLMKRLATPSFWLLSIIGMMTGYGLKEMKRWSWNLFLLSSLLVAYTNVLMVLRYSQHQNKLLAFMASVALLVFMVLRVAREVRVPYFLPRIRWWESNPRYKLVVPVKIERIEVGFDGEILDISMGGCFIKTRNDLEQNEHILCRFTIFGEPLEVGGTIVWRSQSSVTHPKGVGVKFDSLEKTQKKVLKAACSHLRRISSHQRLRHSMTSDDFIRRLEDLKSHRLNITQKPPSEPRAS